MDQKACEDGGENVLVTETSHDESTMSSTLSEKDKGIVRDLKSDCNIACTTPDKADEYFKGKLKEGGIKLQEKCRAIVEFFNCLSCSLRLRGLQKKLATFHNICPMMEVMSKRKFLLKHLAQIIYIIPEAVHIDKLIIHDKKTLCMKPDMVISLQFDIVEGHSEHSDFLALHKVFSSRLMKYFVMHPEESDVPEGALPEPFNQRNAMCLPDQLADKFSEESPLISVETGLPVVESHLHSTFKRHFSQKVVSEAGISENVASSVNLSSTISCSLIREDDNDRSLEDVASAAMSPARRMSPQGSANSSQSPIVKPVIPTPSVMIQTPVQLTPKRSIPNSDVKMKPTVSTGSHSKPAKRILNFSGVESDIGPLNSSDDLQCYDFSQSTERFSSGNLTGSLTASCKEGETHDFLDEHCQKNHNSGVICQESSQLPDLVRVIYHIFKPLNFFAMTKEELMHKIIVNCLDITDRREVEEQIELLEKLVPDWISRKSTSSGDLTFNIDATRDLESVMAKIVHI